MKNLLLDLLTLPKLLWWRVVCRLHGGHLLSAVPVWRDGRARLACSYGCGYETAGIEAPEHRVLPPKRPGTIRAVIRMVGYPRVARQLRNAQAMLRELD